MAAASLPTTFADIHPSIIQTHILPFLDGPSLSSAAAASSYLQTLSSDDNLWSQICRSTWPSVAHPRVHDVISTFSAGHRSFFLDSFPTLIRVDDLRRSCSDKQPVRTTSHSDTPSELISAVDIRYQNEIVYSIVKFTDTTSDFLSSPLLIELTDLPAPRISRPIGIKIDEVSGADDPTLSHLKESVTLDWILIDPTQKRAGNLSSIKPVLVKKHWMTNEIQLRYITVLPGCDPNEMVQCRIEVTCAVSKGGDGLHVREVVLHLQDMDRKCLNGKEFLVITGRALSEENNVTRKRVVGVEERKRRYKEFKEKRKVKVERVKEEEKNRELGIMVNYFAILVSFGLSVYSGSLLFL